MSFEEAARRTVEGASPGKFLLSAAMLLITSITGATLHTVYVDHSRQLSGISQQIDDLVIANQERSRADDRHSADIDTAIGKLADNEQQHSVAIARAEQAIEELQRDHAAPRIERETRAETVAPPNLIDALTHAFSPHRGRYRH